MQIDGQCGCGAVRFVLEGPTGMAAHCHCASCRAFSGAAFLTWTKVPLARFTCEGEEAVRWHRSSDTIRWGFFGTCGTTLFYRADAAGHPEAPSVDAIYVTMGSLRGELDRKPSMHVSFEEHVPWFEPGDALPRFVGKSSVPYADDRT